MPAPLTIYRSLSSSIHWNLALEHFLFWHRPLEAPVFLSYFNDKALIIGKHQNPWKECFIDRIQQDGISLARRKSGGGAVFQDLGNACFCFMTPIFEADKAPLDTRVVNNQIILRALNRFNIPAEVSGRNDLEVKGKKFSGSAYELDLGGIRKQKKALHHGTLLVNVNMKALGNYLNPSKPKLQSKGVDSVISRVINLKELCSDLTTENLTKAIEEEFKEEYKETHPEVREIEIKDPSKVDPQVIKTYEQWTDEKWVLGETPQFSNQFETRFPWGIMDIRLQVDNGIITRAKIFSDCLLPELIDWLEDELSSKHYEYSARGLERLFEEVLPFKSSSAEEYQAKYASCVADLHAWLSKQL